MTDARQPHDDDWTIQAGAYVLGALEQDEAVAFAAHAAGCVRCSDEVEFLRVAAAALPLAVEQVDPSDDVRRRIMRVIEDETAEPASARQGWWRTRPTWRIAGPVLAGAAALLAAGVVAGSLLSDSGPATRTLGASVAAPSGTAQLVRTGGRAELRVTGMPAAPAGRIYQVWLKRDGEDPRPTNALFGVDRSGAASVDVPGDLAGDDDVLVTAEPLGGSAQPTSSPVIRVALS